MDYLMNVFVLLTLILIGNIESRKANLEYESNVLNSLLKNYDPHIRPAGENSTSPVVVTVNMYIRRLADMDDTNMAYDAQVTFRQSWVDSRLKFDGRGDLGYIVLNQPEKIWTPDLFFSNEISGHAHDLITPNVLLRIHPNGLVLFSTRVSLKLSCPMDLSNYPFDNQVCSLVTASYGYTTDDMVLIWKENDPVQITKNLHLPKFALNLFLTDYCTSKTNTGQYGCLKLNMHFSRKFHQYLKTSYLLTGFLVILSWAVFWLNPKNPNLRMGLWIGVMISIIILVNSISSKSPVVSQTDALEVWTGFCIFFIFCVLIEICLTSNVVGEYDDEDLSKMNLNEGRGNQLRSYASFPLRWLNKYTSRAKRADVMSRFLFPVAFAFFNFIYWLAYQNSNTEEDLDQFSSPKTAMKN